MMMEGDRALLRQKRWSCACPRRGVSSRKGPSGSTPGCVDDSRTGPKQSLRVAMSQEQAFLAPMLASPDDLELRRVFADWLQEQGDPRGELLRLTHPLTQEVDCFQLAQSEASLQKGLPF